MRWQAVIVFLAIVVSAIAPPSFHLTAGHDGQAEIGTLDLCHAGTPALSANGDMPCVNGGPCRLFSLEHSRLYGMVNPPCKPVFIAFQDERPPKA